MKVIICDIIWYGILWLVSGAAGYVLFKRCGKRGGYSFVPFYNTYIYYSLTWEILPFLILLGCIPLLLLTVFAVPASLYGGEISALIVVTMLLLHACFCYKQARYFGRGILFAIGLFICDPAFKLLLAVYPDRRREATEQETDGQEPDRQEMHGQEPDRQDESGRQRDRQKWSARKMQRAAGVLAACALVIANTAITPWSQGWGSLRINALNFPDSYMREAVQRGENDLLLTRDDIREFEGISTSWGVLERLFLFPNLKGVNGRDLDFLASTIDTGSNPKLEMLSCTESAITRLDLSKNPELTYLECTENALTSLDVSHNPKLEEIWCDQNAIDALDLSACGDLNWIKCDKNALSSLNVSHNQDLEYLECSWNELDSLDISSNEKLDVLLVSGNRLSGLDVSANPQLVSLICDQNELTSLDVRENRELRYLDVTANDIDTLDVTENTELIQLDCGENDLTELDVTGNTELTSLTCNDNRIRTLNLDENKLLETADCSGNDLISLSANGVECLTDLDVSGNPNLRELDVRGAALKGLDLSDCKEVQSFYGDGQHITIEISYYPKYQEFRSGKVLAEDAVVTGEGIYIYEGVITLDEFTGQTAGFTVPVVDWADVETGEGCISGTITFVEAEE